MADATKATTITIPRAIREALERYKGPGQTYGDVLVELMEEYPPEEFLEEMDRRLRLERRYSMDQVLREAGL